MTDSSVAHGGGIDAAAPDARGPWDAYEFGAPESVLDRSQIFDLFEVVRANRWYEPPICRVGLGKAYRMASHHQSAMSVWRAWLLSDLIGQLSSRAMTDRGRCSISIPPISGASATTGMVCLGGMNLPAWPISCVRSKGASFCR